MSSTEKDGTEWLKLAERKEPARSHRIKNPCLTDQELERVKDEVGELLQMQL